MSNIYVVNPPNVSKRVDDKVYDRVKIQTQKWTPLPDSSGVELIGNVRPVWNKKEKKFSFVPYPSLDDTEKNGKTLIIKNYYKEYDNMHKVISSAMLLYRLLCLFKCTVVSEGPEGYKCTWWITLKHNKTGERLMFGEWKGAAGIWTRFHNTEELPVSYRKDILGLLNKLCAEDCPHPYDGCVAGSVA